MLVDTGDADNFLPELMPSNLQVGGGCFAGFVGTHERHARSDHDTITLTRLTSTFRRRRMLLATL